METYIILPNNVVKMCQKSDTLDTYMNALFELLGAHPLVREKIKSDEGLLKYLIIQVLSHDTVPTCSYTNKLQEKAQLYFFSPNF